MFEHIRRHVLAWTTSAAGTIVFLQAISPPLIDTILGLLIIALVFISAKLAKAGK